MSTASTVTATMLYSGKGKGRDKLQGNKNGCNYWRGGFAVVAVDRVENR